jgi:hypothetical protein
VRSLREPDQLNVHDQGLAGTSVVGIDDHRRAIDFQDANLARTTASVHDAEPPADRQRALLRETSARPPPDSSRIHKAVRLFRWQLELRTLSGRKTNERSS